MSFDFEVPNPSIIGWGGAGVAVVGLAAMLAGGGTALSVAGDFETLEQYEADRNREAYDSLATDIESKQTRGKVFLYGGLGLALLGVSAAVVDYLILDHPPLLSSPSNEHSKLMLGTTTDHGLSVSWIRRF